jgi:riboflavin kinase/FMN adenylyltransferase
MATVDGICHRAVTSVGIRPTIGDNRHTVETFLLDGHHELYGKRMRLDFVQWLRPEVKFEGLEALKVQIGADCRAAASLFDRMPL